MCKPIQCQTCLLSTWIGCGLHIPTAMAGTPKASRCTCVDATTGIQGEFPPKYGTGVAKA
ncbi:hypothetical protein BABINDRAFT_66321 [Babjeviella inositovora NRRL Y-12698]|uniref:Uncharacterized protein n=1 Tax=Babjeviella inositovora NRRL Y-12698 TaxID=984486 RepID=A0A1E3QJW8_9ASCO|nr:uncharacterized protein BABINDRAFT_66321 [Babjeviella inositovora NRRL Y-12698]ODQ77764.1 hypothetical protein BABINDRAFT_66321 [Babjeviella inositovora NRRL Y-12698]